MGQVISTIFKSEIKIRPIGERRRNHSDQPEDVLRILKLYFCSFQKNKIIFSFDFATYCKAIIFQYIIPFSESLQLNHDLF